MSFSESFNVDMFREVSLFGDFFESVNSTGHLSCAIYIFCAYFLDIKQVNYSSVSTTKYKGGSNIVT